MSREDDWKIHEYMGNDLTGFQWMTDEGTARDHAVWNDEKGGYHIPHYSTTWEGASLVIEQLGKNIKFRVRTWITNEGTTVWIERFNDNEFYNVWELLGDALADTFPLALAKAYISAMEERDNERS